MCLFQLLYVTPHKSVRECVRSVLVGKLSQELALSVWSGNYLAGYFPRNNYIGLGISYPVC
jgi:hypothetical protein